MLNHHSFLELLALEKKNKQTDRIILFYFILLSGEEVIFLNCCLLILFASEEYNTILRMGYQLLVTVGSREDI